MKYLYVVLIIHNLSKSITPKWHKSLSLVNDIKFQRTVELTQKGINVTHRSFHYKPITM